jgi:hypothetical protein
MVMNNRKTKRLKHINPATGGQSHGGVNGTERDWKSGTLYNNRRKEKLKGRIKLHEMEMLSQPKRGVMMENPLYNKRANAIISSKLGRNKMTSSRTRNFLEEHAGFIGTVALAFCAVCFVAVPLMLIFDTEYSPKQRRFSLLLYAGIVQPELIGRLVSKTVLSEKHKALRVTNKASVFFLVLAIALYFDPGDTSSTAGAAERTGSVDRRNCSLLQNIPRHFKDKSPQEMFYNKGGDFPLVYEYDGATLKGLELLFSQINEDRHPKCVRHMQRVFFYKLFPPCTKSCEVVNEICKAETNCVRNISFCSSYFEDRNMEQVVTKLEEFVDINKNFYMNIMKPTFESIHKEDENVRKDWAMQLVKKLVAVITDAIDEKRCNPPSQKPCFTSKGSIEESDDGNLLHCQNLEEARTADTEFASRTEESKTFKLDARKLALDVIILILFFGEESYSIFLWAKESSNKEMQRMRKERLTREFNIEGRSVVFLIGLGSFLYLLSVLVFVSVLQRIEEENYGERYWFVYFLLGGSVSVAFYMGTGLILSGIFDNGISIDPSENTSRKSKFLVISWFNTYRKLTSPRGGKFFFAKILPWECIEVIVQTQNLHTFSHAKPQIYVILCAMILWINMMTTPIVLYKASTAAKHEAAKFNIITLTVDTVIDCCFFGLNLIFFQATDVESEPLLISVAISWPLLCVIMRFRTLGRMVTFKYPRVHFTERSSRLVAALSVKKRKTFWGTLSTSRKLLVAMVVLAGASVFINVQLIAVIISATTINAKCSFELGEALWSGASPKRTFRSGIFGPPGCAYEDIEKIEAPGKGLSTISNNIGKCTNMKILNLFNNNINHLPKPMLSMVHLKDVNITHNPVAKKLIAKNMSLDKIPVFVHQHLSKSLVELSLDNNRISQIGDEIERFVRLERLHMRNNRLGPDSLSSKILNLKRLKSFVVSGNPLANSVNWAKKNLKKAKLDDAVSFLDSKFSTSLKSLNLSHNEFQYKHYRDIATSRKFERLESLDLSSNDLVTSPLQPFELHNLSNLIYLRIANNLNIENIDYDDSVEMHQRMEHRLGKYIIEGCKLRAILIKGNGRGNFTTMVFPWLVYNQVRSSVRLLNLQNAYFNNFQLETGICGFPNLEMVYISFYNPNDALVNLINPQKCCMSRLEVLHFLEANIRLTKSVNMSTLKVFKLDFYGHPILPNVEGFIGVNKSLKSVVDLYNVYPAENSTILLELLNVSSLRLRPSKNWIGTLTIPLEWRSFKQLEIGSINNPECIVGSVQHLTIERRVFLENTNVSGPIFKVGPDFDCMQLPGENRTDAFEKRWNISCTNTDILGGETVTSYIVNCSIPSSAPVHLPTNVLCTYYYMHKTDSAKFWQAPNRPDTFNEEIVVYWACFNPSHSMFKASIFNFKQNAHSDPHRLMQEGCSFIS